jgi:IMP dehydrogenase/GMP reductase
MSMNNTKLDFNDVLIRPAIQTSILSRDDIDIWYPDGNLPLITAPMDTVISNENQHHFLSNKIIPCLPRGEKGSENSIESYSLKEITEMYHSDKLERHRGYLIDIANGHINDLETITRSIKNKFGEDIYLMVGNVANPKTYTILSNAGADAVRIGIGNGAGCLTTQQTGVGYPMASLIQECYQESCSLDKPSVIVADGGMKTYSDIIKALALGADFVMLGSIFNKALESAAPSMYESQFAGSPTGLNDVTLDEAMELYESGRNIYKNFRGMSTKEVQKKWGRDKIKTSEGISEIRKVEYTLQGWVENFEHYLKSAMSYTDSKDLSKFIGAVTIDTISNNAYERFNK